MAQVRSRRRMGETAAVFAVGTALGSLLGVLFAPASGQVTRKRFLKELRSARRIASERIGRRLTDAREWLMDHVVNGHNGHRRRTLRPRLAHQPAR